MCGGEGVCGEGAGEGRGARALVTNCVGSQARARANRWRRHLGLGVKYELSDPRGRPLPLPVM